MTAAFIIPIGIIGLPIIGLPRFFGGGRPPGAPPEAAAPQHAAAPADGGGALAQTVGAIEQKGRLPDLELLRAQPPTHARPGGGDFPVDDRGDDGRLAARGPALDANRRQAGRIVGGRVVSGRGGRLIRHGRQIVRAGARDGERPGGQ